MKFGEDLFNNELRPAPSVAGISRSVRSAITAHSANDRFAPEAAVPTKSLLERPCFQGLPGANHLWRLRPWYRVPVEFAYPQNGKREYASSN
jgi:hypothetical protein